MSKSRFTSLSKVKIGILSDLESFKNIVQGGQKFAKQIVTVITLSSDIKIGL